MRWRQKLLRRGDRIEREIEDELSFHLDARTQRYIDAGMTPADARRRALERFGNLDEIRDAVRMIDLGLLGSVWQDVRYGVRTLRKSPGFTATAVLSLALGIGLNSAVFSAIHAVLVRPLPYQDPKRIVTLALTHVNHRNGTEPIGVTPAVYVDWTKYCRSFEAMAIHDRLDYTFGSGLTDFVLTTRDENEHVSGLRVSGSFFEVLGVQPALGRGFLAEEDRPGAAVVILSHAVWRRRFESAPDVVGRDITLDGRSYRVIGVMPEGFRYYERRSQFFQTGVVDLWLPHPFERIAPTARENYTFNAIARLKSGVSLEQARREMRAISQRLEQENPAEYKGRGVAVASVAETVARDSRYSLLLAWGATTLVLLVACANVANLLLARAGARVREIAIRIAMGAGRRRLIRQLLTESLLLGLAGGVAGLAVASWSAKVMTALLPGSDRMVRLEETGVDLRVVAFTFLVALATGVLFGLAPALRGSNVDLQIALHGSGRGASHGLDSKPLGRVLAVIQVGLSLVLLTGAGLMIHSLWRLDRVRLGFDPDRVLTLHSLLPKGPPYATDLRVQKGMRLWDLTHDAMQFPHRAAARLEALPGVESAAVASGVPLLGGRNAGLSVERDRQEEAQKIRAEMWYVTAGYFRTMGIRLVEGRGFDHRDLPGTVGAVVVSQSLARNCWPNETSVLGKRVFSGYPAQPYEVVGVADDVRVLPGADLPAIYLAYSQAGAARGNDVFVHGRLDFWLLVRTQSRPADLAAAAQDAMRDLERRAPIDQVRPMNDVVSDAFGPWRSTTLLLGLLAGLALLLSAIGIYGLMAYTVMQRRHEIGVRMALGATRGDVLRLVMGRGLALSLAGIALGTLAASWLTRFIANQLYGVTPTDPLTFAAVAAVLLGVALLACYVPARRAASVDPVTALRAE
jgi:putative ABC transport system permease protein